MKYDFIATVDNGWYTFSPSGHTFYSRADELKLHGEKRFMEYLVNNMATALVKPVYDKEKIISYVDLVD